jgi:hypothetical protein
MELIDRYLHAIRPWLPLRAPRDEILRELSEDIRCEVDERRGERAEIPEAELVALLKARGHPMAVAARFGAGEALVGPQFYPVFRLVATIALGYVLLPLLLVVSIWTAVRSSHPFESGVQAMFSSMQVMLMFLGVIVTVFAMLERYASASSLQVEWDPRRLPRERDMSEKLRWHAVGIAVGNAILAVAFASFASGLPLRLPGIHDAMLAGAFPGPALTAVFEGTWRMVVALALVNVGAATTIIVQPVLARHGTLAVAAVNAILGALILAAVLPHLGSIREVASLGAGMRAVKAAGPGVDARELGALLGPALDAAAVIFLFAWGIGCLVSALTETWRFTRL